MEIPNMKLWKLLIFGGCLTGCLKASSGRTLDQDQAVLNHRQHDASHLLSRSKRDAYGVNAFIADIMSYQELDIIFILDRSTGVGARTFYLEEVKLAKDIVHRFLRVHPDGARVAVITFGKDVRLAWDGISQTYPRDPVSKCDLFHDSTHWNKAEFVEGPGYADGTNIADALAMAKLIFQAGRVKRNPARQVVLLMTDAELNSVNDQDPKQASEDLRREGVGIYGVGVGEYLNKDAFTPFLPHPSNYADMKTWRDNVAASARHSAVNNRPQYRLILSDLCSCPARASCYCDVNTGYMTCACSPGYYLFQGTCRQTCQVSQCSGDSVCLGPEPTVHCECLPGAYGDNCDQRFNHCTAQPCQNGGTCFSGVENYVCACPWGWSGKDCDINDNECMPGICPKNSACRDDVNNVQCACADGRQPPCDASNAVTGNGSTPSGPDVRPFGVVEEHPDDEDEKFKRQLLIFAPAGAAALVAIIASIATLSYVLKRGKRKGPRSLHTDTTSVISRNPSLLTFDSKCYKDEGTPMAPPLERPDLVPDESIYEEALYGNEPIQRGMEDWFPYVLEMLTSGGLSRVLLVRLDGEKWVLSPGCKFRMSEIDNIYKVLSKQVARGSIYVQRREYGVVSNEEFFLVGHSLKNDEKHPQEIACATKTRQFVLVATANFAEDGGRCKAELMRLRVYIKEQGL